MTWTKLGDEFGDEARDLTDAEWRTHVEALLWSNKRLLDLRVPKRDVKRFAESPDAEQAIKGLVAKGWWEDCGDAWFVGVYFPEWQRERVQVEHRREQLRIAQDRKRKHARGDHSLCLPGKCPSAPLPSSDASTVDASDESPPDPGRVGSGLSAPPDPTVQNQDQPQDQEQPIAKSQHRRFPDGPGTVADDAQQFPLDHSESPAAGGTARASEPAAPVRRCEFEGCAVPEKALPDDSRFHVGCDVLARLAERAQAKAVAL